MLKVVIDANVWVSCLLSKGKAQQIRELLESGKFELACSPVLLKELINVLARPKFKQSILPEDAINLVALISLRASFLNVIPFPPVSRDPKDDPYLACAMLAEAEYLITGDKDLLTLKNFGKTEIISMSEFLHRL